MQMRRGFKCIRVDLVVVVVVVESSGCGGCGWFLPAAILSTAI
jgi:hypothetical protein